MIHIFFIEAKDFFLAIDARMMEKFTQMLPKPIRDFEAEDIISHSSYSRAPHQ